MYRTIFYVRHRAFSGIQLDMLAKDHHSPAWWQLFFPHRGEDRKGYGVLSWVSNHPFQTLVSNSAVSTHGARGIGWQCLENGSFYKAMGGVPIKSWCRSSSVATLRVYTVLPTALEGSLMNSSVLQSEFGGLIPRFVIGTLRRGSRRCLHLSQERKFSNTWCNSHVEEFEYGSMREKNKDF